MGFFPSFSLSVLRKELEACRLTSHITRLVRFPEKCSKRSVRWLCLQCDGRIKVNMDLLSRGVLRANLKEVQSTGKQLNFHLCQ